MTRKALIRGCQVVGFHRSGARAYALTRLYWETRNRGAALEWLRHEVSVAVCFEPRDCWIGLFWEHHEFERWVFYLCLLPCLPLRVKYRRHWG